MGKIGQSSRLSDTGTKRESSLLFYTAACKLPSGKGSRKRHKIGKCYPAICGFCSAQGVSKWKALTAPGL